ncbi:unnamed protein product [Cuscuta epithymum]|uniref:DUF4005 domain-containing protein n=1 Tax=Cuscuta epithymum TaxID=186058 RepID=A0AAV0FQC5_9ASTE|nr:unnamed protein product [Cuscuta epithymum]CAH9137849.1 unnamed protein product [Cuscuta epithymum]
MGRSAATCFKMLTCARTDSTESDGFEAPESKCSSDQRGWSFVKRSKRHRVLSNTLTISETLSGIKDSPAAAVINSQIQPDASIPTKSSTEQLNPNFPEKNSTELPSGVADKINAKEPVECTDEKPQSPPSMDDKSLETVASEVNGYKIEPIMKESDIIVIQTSIRGFLAQISLLKHKNAIKLQAAIRGLVVRRQAAGTLRCIQAIVKMQALVRARRGHKSSNGETQISSKKLESSYLSIEKLLSNRFARQLLESSSSRAKTIGIKCDPSKPDSAWVWLERWMFVSTGLSPSSQTTTEQVEKKKDIDHLLDNSLLEEAAVIQSESKTVESSLEASEENDYFPIKTETEHGDEHNLFFGSEEESSIPVFIAAQSNFEERSLLASSAGNPTNLSSQETETKHLNESSVSVQEMKDLTENSTGLHETEHLTENFTGLHTPVLVVAGSECSTELSISSTLDSPDRYEIKIQDYHHERTEDVHIDSLDQTISHNELPNDGTVGTPDFTPIKDITVEHADVESPRSHVTFLESQGTTPSKEASSVKPKVRSSEKNGPNSNKRHNISSSNPKKDTAVTKTSLHQLLPNKDKDHKGGKRRRSFGSAKSEQNVDQQEPRDSNASSSLPSYMQATESAKAKAILSISPRSSPDAHNKETYSIKKRHSLPNSNGRQGSPHIQRSLSQAQQNAKGNPTHSPQERRWQR